MGGGYSYWTISLFSYSYYHTFLHVPFQLLLSQNSEWFRCRLCEDPLDQVLGHFPRPATPHVATTSTWTFSDADHHIFHQEGQTVALGIGWGRVVVLVCRMFMTCGKIAPMPAIFTRGSFDYVFLVQNPISFKAGLDASDLYGHLVVAGSLV